MAKEPKKAVQEEVKDEKAPETQFGLLRQYLKDASVEFPSSPQIFKENHENTMNMDIDSNSTKVDENIYEVTLRVSLNIKSPASKTILIVECTYAGIFEISNIADSELEILLNVHALEILFPYVREVVSSLSMRTSMPPILLPPINFVQFYQQRIKDKKDAPANEKKAD